MIYLVQGWASAKARFGKAAAEELESFTNNTLLFGGVGDADWLRDLERRCGQVRVFRTSASTGGQRGSGGVQTSEDWQPVIRAHEIGQLAEGQALLLAGSLPPVLTYLPKLNEDPDWLQIQAEVEKVRATANTARDRVDQQRRRQMATAAHTWQAHTRGTAAKGGQAWPRT